MRLLVPTSNTTDSKAAPLIVESTPAVRSKLVVLVLTRTVVMEDDVKDTVVLGSRLAVKVVTKSSMEIVVMAVPLRLSTLEVS